MTSTSVIEISQRWGSKGNVRSEGEGGGVRVWIFFGTAQ